MKGNAVMELSHAFGLGLRFINRQVKSVFCRMAFLHL